MNDEPIISFQVAQIFDLVVIFQDQDGDPIDISSAADMKIRIAQPDGQVGDHVATLLNDGLDGAVVFRTVAETFPFHGWFDVQGLCTVAGTLLMTEVAEVFAKGNLAVPTGEIVAPIDVGTPGADGSYRLRTVGGDLVVEKCVAGVYVESGRFN